MRDLHKTHIGGDHSGSNDFLHLIISDPRLFQDFFKANNLLDAKRERYLKTMNKSNLEYEGQKSDKTIVGTYKYGRTFLLGVRYKL